MLLSGLFLHVLFAPYRHFIIYNILLRYNIICNQALKTIVYSHYHFVLHVKDNFRSCTLSVGITSIYSAVVLRLATIFFFFRYFMYDGLKHTCMEGDHIVNIFSFSKAYGMMGWRVGYVSC